MPGARSLACSATEKCRARGCALTATSSSVGSAQRASHSASDSDERRLETGLVVPQLTGIDSFSDSFTPVYVSKCVPNWTFETSNDSRCPRGSPKHSPSSQSPDTSLNPLLKHQRNILNRGWTLRRTAARENTGDTRRPATGPRPRPGSRLPPQTYSVLIENSR